MCQVRMTMQIKTGAVPGIQKEKYKKKKTVRLTFREQLHRKTPEMFTQPCAISL